MNEEGQLQINGTVVFTRNFKEYQSGKRFIVNQAGARSGKTFAIIQLLIYICFTEPGTKCTIVRKTLPDMRASALADFVEIMMDMGLYNLKQHNKTEQKYMFKNGSIIEFKGIQKGQKMKGAKRDICYLNEADELSFDDFNQLDMRTQKCMFVDFNPSEGDHWLYQMIDRETAANRAVVVKSTYKDNKFLTDENRIALDNLVNVDINYYKMYCLGERPDSNTRIYTHFKAYGMDGDVDVDALCDDWCYGLDFGYNHPTALVKIMWYMGDIYIKEKVYESGLTVGDLCGRVKRSVEGNKMVYCDSARPDIISELNSFGLNACGADKSVKEGINEVKSNKIFIHVDSKNIWKEYRMYLWKSDKNGRIFDEPIKVNDDSMDAIRYGIYSHRSTGYNEKYTYIYY